MTDPAGLNMRPDIREEKAEEGGGRKKGKEGKKEGLRKKTIEGQRGKEGMREEKRKEKGGMEGGRVNERDKREEGRRKEEVRESTYPGPWVEYETTV